MKKVAIIGAGLTGLSIANGLRHSHVVEVFEKARGRSGRMTCKRFDWGQADIGAQYFTARDTKFKTFVAQLISRQIIAPWDFTPHHWTDAGLLLSPDEETRYVGFTDMGAIARYLAEGLNLHLSTRVVGVARVPQGWHLHVQHGVSGEIEELDTLFDTLILTCPAEQTDQLLHSINTPVASSIHNTYHDPCWTVALRTHTPVDPDVTGVFCATQQLRWLANDSAKPGRRRSDNDNTFVIQFDAEFSAMNQDEPKANIVQHAVDRLSLLMEKQIMVEQHHAHFWRYASVKPNAPQPTLLVDVEQNLFVAGDWSRGGRVENAWLSAQDILQYLA